MPCQHDWPPTENSPSRSDHASHCFFSAVALLCGCAAVHVNATRDATAPGLHFYRPDFYLLVSQVEDGKFESKIIVLPNKAEEYVITSTTGLFGTAEANATLENGWNLTVFGAKADSKVSETITALGSLIPSLPFATNTTTERNSAPRIAKPLLYRMEFENGKVSRLTQVDLFDLPTVVLKKK